MNLCCPLCEASRCSLLHQDPHRPYFQCSQCGLVFVPSDYFLSSEDEKAVYDQHENHPDDPRYRQFLDRLCQPTLERIDPNSQGLDFGSGPGPTLSQMLMEAGHQVDIYDLFYAHDPSVFAKTYHFITASEVVEHLHQPRRELNRLWNCLRVGGLLGIMTKLLHESQSFAEWHYRRDPTHVIFFREETFQWLESYWHADLIVAGEDVRLLIKR